MNAVMRTLRMVAVFLMVLSFAALFAALPKAASAASEPRWSVASLADTTVAPGADFHYLVQIKNVGNAPSDGTPISVVAGLPQGVTAVSAEFQPEAFEEPGQLSPCVPADGSPALTGASSVRCEGSAMQAPYGNQFQSLLLTVHIDLNVKDGTILTSSFTVSGGGTSVVTSVADATRVNASPLPFGIDAFDAAAVDSSELPSVQAGAHPANLRVSLDFNTLDDSVAGSAWPVEPLKDASTDLPAGFIGNPQVVDDCSAIQLAMGTGTRPKPECLPSTQVGNVYVRMNNGSSVHSEFGPVALYNMEPPVGAPARFGFNLAGVVVVLDVAVRTGQGYRITTGSKNTSEALAIAGVTFDFWGTPSSSEHDLERGCAAQHQLYEGTCSSPVPDPDLKPFFRNPTSCAGPASARWDAHVTSWYHSGTYRPDGSPDLSDPNWKSSSILSHDAPGYPYAPEDWGPARGMEGCSEVPFGPSLDGLPPKGTEAAKPTSFTFDLSMPQSGLEEPDSISESDLKLVEVALPEGVRVNPSSVDGLGSCSPALIGLISAVGQSPARFSNEPGGCPENAKIGDLQITTPLLDHNVPGAVYLAQPTQNPFGSLLALYLVAHDPDSGVTIKLAGRVEADSKTGQITTRFDDNPQLPFTNLHLELKSGPRAALVTPSTCGTYTTHSTFTGWSGKTVKGDSSFTIDQGCVAQGFSPKLSAGTQNPLAGSFSPFSLRLTRSDSDQEFSSLSVTMPQGLSGKLAGIPYCPQAAIDVATARIGIGQGALELNSPLCPAASQVGTVTAGAGAGISPFFLTTGRAYLAGPYKGAPLSFFTEVPVVAGPFDLGVTVDRVALNVDPETARITAVSDPLPSVLQGIPLQIRDIRVNVNRPSFTLNPTSCEPMSVAAAVRSIQGATANPSDHFQVANCDRLAFKPKLGLRLNGGIRRGDHPALRATLTMPKGGANIARTSVALPHSEFLAQSHIGTICTRVQFAADACPAKSVYGHARAFSPLLDQPLEGPVYLRSSTHPLPDLVASLDGQINVDLAGRIDSVHGGIRASFETVPDAPVSKFVLTMKGGKKGLLENSRSLCGSTNRATVKFDGQNGKFSDFKPRLKARCGKASKHHRR
jgi:hypothetical protein